MNRWLLAGFLGVVISSGFVPVTLVQTQGKNLQEQVKNLVVRINGEFPDGTPTYGSGIIFGANENRLYIATASHVVQRREGKKSSDSLSAAAARNLTVLFAPLLPGERFPARVLAKPNTALDLAILVVLPQPHRPSINDLRFDVLAGEEYEPKPRQEVYHMGYMGNSDIVVGNYGPDFLSRVERDVLHFESSTVGEGQSGGALVTDDGNLIGMVVADSPPEGRAIKIKTILDTVRESNYPATLVSVASWDRFRWDTTRWR